MAAENSPIDSLAAACKCCLSINKIPLDKDFNTTLAIYVPVYIVLALIAILFMLLLRKYTLKDWGTEENPYKKETFAMPRGVLRGILTLGLLFIVIILELVNLQVHCFEHSIDQFLVAFQMMIAFYFGSKVMHHVTAADKDKTDSMAKAVANGNGEKRDFEDADSSG